MKDNVFSLYICSIAGLDHVGQLKAGKRADILLFDENLTLTETMVAGSAYRS